MPIDLVGPRAVPASTTTVAVRGHSRLRPGDVQVHGGLRVTSATFTVCDLAAVVSEAALLRRADRFIAVAAFSLEDLRLMTARFREIEGVEKLRSVLDQLAPSSRWTRSDGERMWLRIVRELDVPDPRADHRASDAEGNRRYLDFAWPDRKLAVEIDLHPTHGTTIGRRDDGRRQNALVLAGWTVLRFDLADLMTRPDYVLRTVEQAFHRGSQA
ncbi:MAG: endonuclease domain-containing protein [Actinobacteria bacterium]|nr:endonuclease domain-containing protein [Actinomycetota bacterium]